jgi:hypothetical protein
MLAGIIVWRFVKAHLFRNILGVFYTTPALTKHSDSILISVSLAQLISLFNRQ